MMTHPFFLQTQDVQEWSNQRNPNLFPIIPKRVQNNFRQTNRGSLIVEVMHIFESEVVLNYFGYKRKDTNGDPMDDLEMHEEEDMNDDVVDNDEEAEDQQPETRMD